jgi:hypothetical protein
MSSSADFLDAATELAEDFTGRTYRRQVVVETYDGGRDVIGLYQTPVQSVTALTENGVTLPSTNYVVDLTAGTIQRGTLYGPGLLWLPGLQNITVTYVAGPSVLKARVRLAVLELTRHLWETQRGGSNQPGRPGRATTGIPVAATRSRTGSRSCCRPTWRRGSDGAAHRLPVARRREGGRRADAGSARLPGPERVRVAGRPGVPLPRGRPDRGQPGRAADRRLHR